MQILKKQRIDIHTFGLKATCFKLWLFEEIRHLD